MQTLLDRLDGMVFYHQLPQYFSENDVIVPTESDFMTLSNLATQNPLSIPNRSITVEKCKELWRILSEWCLESVTVDKIGSFISQHFEKDINLSLEELSSLNSNDWTNVDVEMNLGSDSAQDTAENNVNTEIPEKLETEDAMEVDSADPVDKGGPTSTDGAQLHGETNSDNKTSESTAIEDSNDKSLDNDEIEGNDQDQKDPNTKDSQTKTAEAIGSEPSNLVTGSELELEPELESGRDKIDNNSDGNDDPQPSDVIESKNEGNLDLNSVKDSPSRSNKSTKSTTKSTKFAKSSNKVSKTINASAETITDNDEMENADANEQDSEVSVSEVKDSNTTEELVSEDISGETQSETNDLVQKKDHDGVNKTDTGSEDADGSNTKRTTDKNVNVEDDNGSDSRITESKKTGIEKVNEKSAQNEGLENNKLADDKNQNDQHPSDAEDIHDETGNTHDDPVSNDSKQESKGTSSGNTSDDVDSNVMNVDQTKNETQVEEQEAVQEEANKEDETNSNEQKNPESVSAADTVANANDPENVDPVTKSGDSEKADDDGNVERNEVIDDSNNSVNTENQETKDSSVDVEDPNQSDLTREPEVIPSTSPIEPSSPIVPEVEEFVAEDKPRKRQLRKRRGRATDSDKDSSPAVEVPTKGRNKETENLLDILKTLSGKKELQQFNETIYSAQVLYPTSLTDITSQVESGKISSSDSLEEALMRMLSNAAMSLVNIHDSAVTTVLEQFEPIKPKRTKRL